MCGLDCTRGPLPQALVYKSREGLLCLCARGAFCICAWGMWDSNFGPQQGTGQPPGLTTQSSQGQTILGDANSNAYGQNPSLEWLIQGEGGGGPGGAMVQELVKATNCSPMMCAQALQQAGDDPQRSANCAFGCET